MAPSLVTEELTALVETRARLEAALGSDENWRALQQAAGQNGEPDESAARRARNTRLKMALAESPLYQAWKHVNEAIDALREVAAGARDAGPRASAPQAVQDVPRPAGGRLVARLAAASTPAAAAPSPAPAPTAPQATGGSTSAPAPPPKAPVGSRAADRDVGSGPSTRGRADLEPEEATVTFVRRELPPSAQLSADLGTGGASVMIDHMRDAEGAPDLPKEVFDPPGSDAEEAEVVIVPADERADTIPRLRKAQTGD